MKRAAGAKETYLRLVRECLRFPGDLLLALVGAAAVAASGLRLAWLFKEWTEGPLLARESAGMGRILAQALLLTFLLVASILVSRYFTASVNQKVLARLRDEAAARILESRFADVRSRPAGDLLSRVFTDVGAVGGFVETGVKRLIGDGLVFLGALVMMFIIDVRLAVAACLLVPLIGALILVIGVTIRRWSAAAQKAIGETTSTLSEQIAGLTTIKAFGMEPSERERFTRRNAAFRRDFLRVEWWSAALVATVFFATGAGLLGAVAVLSRRLLRGDITAAELLTFFLYAAMVVEPARRLAQVQSLLQRSLAAAVRVFEVLDQPEREDRLRGEPLTSAEGEIRLERVLFRYGEGGSAVLDRLDLHLAAREQVAVVAESGGGKSTLARLLVRFHEPDEGRILLDRQVIALHRLDDLRRAICLIEQETFIFAGPLLENLRYGSPRASRKDAQRAAETLGLAPLVRSLPRGIDSELAEAGRNLSGGERQRIALARAVLRDPAVLVLDEATNALDGETETAIFDALGAWLSRRTVLLFAHRLSTVARFPRVAVLQKGRIVEEGTVGDLLARSAVFARLVAEQAGRGTPAAAAAFAP